MPSVDIDIIALLKYLGLTKEQFTPLAIIAFILYFLIGLRLKPIKKFCEKASGALIEIQTLLKNIGYTLSQDISNYGRGESPIVLKPEYRPFITETNLDKQIEEKKEGLLKWLKSQKPNTGIDAQEKISYLVLSGKIEKYLNLKDYERHLYQEGKTARDTMGILSVYLFEILIPKLKL